MSEEKMACPDCKGAGHIQRSVKVSDRLVTYFTAPCADTGGGQMATEPHS